MQAALEPKPALSSDDELHWLALRVTPGLGTRKAGQLIEIFRTPQAVFRASRSELEASGVAPGVAQSIASGCGFEDAVTQQQRRAEAGATLVTITDPRYPPRLRDIYDPPPVLFVRGRIELLASLMVGVVGTRRPTVYGTVAAERLASDLAGAGLTIVSGMARGIDTAAHRAVLKLGLAASLDGADTVAVFGSGVDQVYPAENRRLAEEIGTRGLIVSELPMGSPPYPQNFPVRNRIISGMSVGVLVVEGGEYSGSAITAKLAAEQNREVFAVPGNITSRQSWGPNQLIKQGAKLVQEWNDVVVELTPEDRRQLIARFRNQLKVNGKSEDATSDPIQASLASGSITGAGAPAQAVLAALKPDSAVSLDHLVESIEGHSASEIIATLFELELAGLVRQLPGKSFLKVWAD
jgi:DNA processing protein